MPFDFDPSRYSTIELAAIAAIVLSVAVSAYFLFSIWANNMKAGGAPLVRSVHVLTCAAQYLINLLDQWLEERLGIVVKRKCAADL